MMESSKENQTYWIGIDWGGAKHTVAVCDNTRRIVSQFETPTTLEGLNMLSMHLKKYDCVGGIAIEATRDPVIVHMLKEGYAVYPINPKLSHNWRKCASVAGVKSDEYDACLLAQELSRRHESLKAMSLQDSEARQLLGLCDTLRSLIDQRTSYLQQLRAVLLRYYPAALDFWGDLTAPSAWAFIKKFPTPEALVRARKSTLIAFLRAHRIGVRPCWLERIERSHQADQWPASHTALGDQYMALVCVSLLQALEAKIRGLEKMVETKSKDLDEFNLIESLPGAGKALAPAITAIIANLGKDDDIREQLRCMAGIAPVRDESGKRIKTIKRQRCNKRWRNVFHLFAWCSIRYSGWAKAFYECCRERGDAYGTALRKLSDKWIRIIVSMIREGTPYDEQKYIEALRKHGSPLYERICG